MAQDTDAHVIGDPDGFYGEQVMAWADGKVQKLRMREIAAAEAAPAAGPAADQAGAVLS